MTKILELTDDEFSNLESLLTYCKNFHPSSELKQDAKHLLISLYQPKLFDLKQKNNMNSVKQCPY